MSLARGSSRNPPILERDIRAVLNGLTLLVADTKEAGQLQAMRNYAAIMALCADLRRSATEYNGTPPRRGPSR